MSIDAKALLAKLSEDAWCSGPELAEHFGVSRAAVSKRVQALRDAAWPVVAESAHGSRRQAPVDLIDTQALQAAGPDIAIDSHLHIPSTSDHLLARPFDGPCLCVAEHQTGGRGRRGRQWTTQPGTNLTLSLDWRFEQPQAPMTGLSPAVAVLLADALALPAIRIKWPNDLVVESRGGLRKLGGILIDAAGEPGGPTRVVVGVGINVHMQAAAIDQPWVALRELADTVSRTKVAIAVARALVDGLPMFEAGGFEAFRARYAARDALADRAITIQGAGSVAAGQASGLAADGGLRVRSAGVDQVVYAGDVSVRAA